MPHYSNEASLKAAWSAEEVDAILQSEPATAAARLEKAAKTAEDEINTVLHSAGYIVPFAYTEFGVDPPLDGSAPLLPGTLQQASDAFTMWALCHRTDFQKKNYEDEKVRWEKWLERVRIGELRITLNGIEGPTGSGNVRVIARPRVFTASLKRPEDIFPLRR